jgi:restriction system protein
MTANRSINVGYFVTTGIFTLEAIRFAEDKNIDLIDGSRLIDLMKTANMSTEPRSDISPVSQTPEKSIPSPLCPKCGVVMVLRMARKGERIGQKFWGCSNYPDCKVTLGVKD